MKCRVATLIVLTTLGLIGSSVDYAGAQTGGGALPSGPGEQTLRLTSAQKSAIYAAVSKDKTKTSPRHFTAMVGADVPPMIELYALPDDIVAANPTAELYRYTLLENQVVVVDPTKMRVIDVIGPAP